MSWFAALPAVVVTLILLFVPGLVVAFLLRQRGLRLFALAPALSVSLIVVASLAAPFVGIRWSILPVAALTAIAAAAAVAWSRFVVRPVGAEVRRRVRVDWAVVGAFLIPALVIGFVLVRSIGDPEYFSQRYDNFFHFNAIQYVLDTGNASPLWLGTMTSPAGLPFYPSGWHAVVSLVVSLSGASVAVAANAAVIVVACAVWPIGAVFVTRTLLGRSRVVTIAAGVLSAAFPAFPFLPLHYGVLYPLFLGLALVPVALALAYLLLRPGKVGSRLNLALLLILSIPGISVAHPGALMALVALTVPFVLAFLTHRFLHAPDRRGRVVVALIGAAYAAAGVILLAVVRPPASQIYWPVIETLPGAIGEVVAASVYQYPAAHALAVFLVVGAYSAIRRGGYARWSLLGMAAVGSILYVVVASSPYEILRFWLTATWYNNTPRLASIWVLAVLPLAASGVSTIVTWLLRRQTLTWFRRAIARAPQVAVILLGVLLVVLTQGSAIRQAAADIEFTYKLRPGGPIVSPDELQLMDDLDELTPKDAVIAGDPWTGASFAYGISGRRVLMPHLLMDLSDDAKIINTKLATAGDSKAVCDALAATGVDYVLDFSADGDFQENPDDYSGLEHLDRSPYVKLVEARGDAKLYQVISCEGSR
ncbi:MAG TPA: DUF6541 family protein [Microbacterium sp.]|nr:DUF6541 family protein [Microbacterium sp.]